MGLQALKMNQVQTDKSHPNGLLRAGRKSEKQEIISFCNTPAGL
jgi:hypothetical protein